jgi:pSer/pThr/pTyr-binding forkhead associated (FHA) protein
MGDPRLNSLHLEPNRREQYRRVRQEVLQARGLETLYAERKMPDNADPTVMQADHSDSSLHDNLLADFWVSDRVFVFPLKVGINTLGRSSENDVPVDDLYVSRRHCIILVHSNGSCEIYDTASKNGTYLNGKRVTQPTALRSGDEIRICTKHYIFHSRHSGQASRNNNTQTRKP